MKNYELVSLLQQHCEENPVLIKTPHGSFVPVNLEQQNGVLILECDSIRITADEFHEILSRHILEDNPHLRKGQKLMNIIHDVNPELYDFLTLTVTHDCFHVDDMIAGTISYLKSCVR